MSIATVVTRGYGSFGNIAHVVTAGYDIGKQYPPKSKTYRRQFVADLNYRRQFKGSKPT